MGRSERFWDDMYGSGMPVWKVCAERPEGGRVLFEGASVEVAVRRGRIFFWRRSSRYVWICGTRTIIRCNSNLVKVVWGGMFENLTRVGSWFSSNGTAHYNVFGSW
jgi:hypothetical protein